MYLIDRCGFFTDTKNTTRPIYSLCLCELLNPPAFSLSKGSLSDTALDEHSRFLGRDRFSTLTASPQASHKALFLVISSSLSIPNYYVLSSTHLVFPTNVMTHIEIYSRINTQGKLLIVHLGIYWSHLKNIQVLVMFTNTFPNFVWRPWVIANGKW